MLHRAMLIARFQLGRLKKLNISGAVNHFWRATFYSGGVFFFFFNGGGFMGIATTWALGSAVANPSVKNLCVFFAKTITLTAQVYTGLQSARLVSLCICLAV